MSSIANFNALGPKNGASFTMPVSIGGNNSMGSGGGSWSASARNLGSSLKNDSSIGRQTMPCAACGQGAY